MGLSDYINYLGIYQKLFVASILHRFSQVEVHAEVVVKLVELFADAFAHGAHLAVLAIVLQAVLEDEVQIVEEVLEFQVLVRVELLLDRTEVHWLLDDVKVVGDVQLLGIHRFVKDPCLMVLPNRCDHALGCLIPALINGLVFIDLGQFKRIDRCRGFSHILSGHEVVCQLWVVCAELGPLFITQRLILSILEYLELEASGVEALVGLLLRGLQRNRGCCGGCLRGFLKVILALEFLLWDCIVLLEKFHDCGFIRLLSELIRRLILVIYVCSLCAAL